MADETEILTKTNGPLVLDGKFLIKDGDGREFDLAGRTKISLCRCGHSNNKPFCDGRHNQAGFNSKVEAIKLPPKH